MTSQKTNGIRSTILGLFCLGISSSIYIPIEFFGNGVKFISVSSLLIGFFCVTGVISLFGKDRLLNKLFEAVINLINRIKK